MCVIVGIKTKSIYIPSRQMICFIEYLILYRGIISNKAKNVTGK